MACYRVQAEVPIVGVGTVSQIVEPIEGPLSSEPLRSEAIAAPRLARHQLVLEDGHLVGVTVAGEGVPLVVVH